MKEKTESKENKTICWDCKRASGYMGGCNWSNYCIGICETPEVEGWLAEKHTQEKITTPLSKIDGGLTFKVINCPEFEPDIRTKTVAETCVVTPYECPFNIKMYAKISDNNILTYIIEILDVHSEEIIDTLEFKTEREALNFYNFYDAY